MAIEATIAANKLKIVSKGTVAGKERTYTATYNNPSQTATNTQLHTAASILANLGEHPVADIVHVVETSLTETP